MVLVPKAQTFYINGEVHNQGALIWQRNMTLSGRDVGWRSDRSRNLP